MKPVASLASITILCVAALPAFAQERMGSRYRGPDPEPSAWPTPTRYISPQGTDSNSGASPSAPWKTFAHAVARLRPGDVLGVMDGTYTLDTTGMLAVRGKSGTAEAPITVRAVNERRAVLRSDGLISAVSLSDVRYWNILGLTVHGADKAASRGVYSIVLLYRVSDVALKRVVAEHSNRTGWNGNNGMIFVSESQHVLVEECECYRHHRHGITFWKSQYCTARRNYINPRFHRGPGQFSDEAIVCYGSSWCRLENNISEGLNVGFHVHGGETTNGIVRGSHNRLYGNISIDGLTGGRYDARGTASPATDNRLKDHLVIRPRSHGIWLSSATDTIVENATVYLGGSNGMRADVRGNAPTVPGGMRFTLRNSLLWSNATYGLSVTVPVWEAEYCNFYANRQGNVSPSEALGDAQGHVRSSISVAPSGMGLGAGQSLVYVPANSNMKARGAGGADIGANILYRYRDGVLTAQPLWDPATGAFPHGAIVPGVNDLPGASAFDVHTRLNVSPATLPAGYGGPNAPAPVPDPAPAPLPDPWQSRDIGSVGLAGSASFANSAFSVSASGADIAGTADAFRFVYQPLAGDGQIVARVASLTNTHASAKAGVMIRQSLEPDSVYSMLAVTPGSGAVFQRRFAAAGESFSLPAGTAVAPSYVKVVRTGSLVSAFASPDGTAWSFVGADTIPMDSTAQVGLALTSHNDAALTTATFDNVTVTATPAGGRCGALGLEFLLPLALLRLLRRRRA